MIAVRMLAKPVAQRGAPIRRSPPFLLHTTEVKRSFKVVDLLGRSLLSTTILVECISALFNDYFPIQAHRLSRFITRFMYQIVYQMLKA